MNETVEKWTDIGIHSLARPTITSLFKQTGTYIKHILFFLPRHVCSLNYIRQSTCRHKSYGKNCQYNNYVFNKKSIRNVFVWDIPEEKQILLKTASILMRLLPLIFCPNRAITPCTLLQKLRVWKEAFSVSRCTFNLQTEC